jgi:hypothetical protein
MSLSTELKKFRAKIKTESYAVSIGEIINMYQADELDIHPSFQRVYRWSAQQKSSLIESILLGIPLPSIFVATRDDGVWDVVDGVQRLSTILQFAGVLKDDKNKKVETLVLEEPKFLKSMKGRTFDGKSKESFDSALRIEFKRAKLGVNIISKGSDKTTKYELFQRLNGNGSPLSEQEMRNCILVLEDINFYEQFKALAEFVPYCDSVAISERGMKEAYDMDLALRFLIFSSLPVAEFSKLRDLNDFISTRMLDFIKQPTKNIAAQFAMFKRTFSLLNEVMGDEAFKRYDSKKEKFMGPFLVSSFETVACGVSFNLSKWEKNKGRLRSQIEKIWNDRNFTSNARSGINAASRVSRTIEFGRKHFR